MATHVPADGAGGGMVRYAVELATSLTAHPDVELHVLARAAARNFFVDLLGDSQRVRTLPDLPTPVLSLIEHVRVGRPGSFDVLHGTKHVVPLSRRTHRMLTVHDMLPMDRPDDFSIAKRLLLRPTYRRSIRRADSIVCVSEATLQRLRVIVPTSAPSTVVPLAVSGTLRTATSVPLASVQGVPFAIVVGDSSPRKNVGLIVDAWRDVLAEEPKAKLVVVGPPSWGRTVVGEHFDRLRAEGHLVAPGHLSDGQLRWCYEHARVALCPSMAEGFGLPAAEALAFGAPVITSEDPALCEVTGTRALHLRGDDPRSWVQAILDALARPRTTVPPESTRTWADVADETVRAARNALT
ncbi:MAG: hypothetical protein QOG69_341 [Actinomycetota bacterium]|nr:hypothetical protein [Actinomycetota bacterium]